MKTGWIVLGGVSGLICATLIYLLGAWIAWSPDPGRWLTEGRFIVGILMVSAIALMTYVGVKKANQVGGNHG